MKFLAVKGNPYVAVGPSGKVYRFYERVAQPVEVTHPVDLVWAQQKTQDTRPYPKSLRPYEEVMQELEEKSKKVLIFNKYPQSVPAVEESIPLPPEEDVPAVEESIPLPPEEAEESVEEAPDFAWFQELSPEDLSLSVKKLLVKIEDFLVEDDLLTLPDRIEYIRGLISEDSRKTLATSVEELIASFTE